MYKEKMLERMKKKGKELDPNEKEAKMGVVKELSRQASSMLSDKSKPKAKVEVAANSKEGLKEGLEKAEELLEGDKPEGMEEGKPDACDISPEEAELSAEDLDEKIKKLMELKDSKKSENSNPFA